MLTKEEKRIQRNIKERDRLRAKRNTPKLSSDELFIKRKEQNKKKREYNRNLMRSKRATENDLCHFIAELV